MPVSVAHETPAGIADESTPLLPRPPPPPTPPPPTLPSSSSSSPAPSPPSAPVPAPRRSFRPCAAAGAVAAGVALLLVLSVHLFGVPEPPPARLVLARPLGDAGPEVALPAWCPGLRGRLERDRAGMEALRDSLRDAPEPWIVDLGAGTGHASLLVAALGGRAVAIERRYARAKAIGEAAEASGHAARVIVRRERFEPEESVAALLATLERETPFPPILRLDVGAEGSAALLGEVARLVGARALRAALVEVGPAVGLETAVDGAFAAAAAPEGRPSGSDVVRAVHDAPGGRALLWIEALARGGYAARILSGSVPSSDV